jgi:hypothetical protein
VAPARRRTAEPEAPADDEVKGPDPEHWSDEAREERGAERSEAAKALDGPQFGDDGELVKGPDPEHWSDEAREDRGAELRDEQRAEAAAIPEAWSDDEVEAARKKLKRK